MLLLPDYQTVQAIGLIFAVIIVPPVFLRIRLMYTTCWLCYTAISYYVLSGGNNSVSMGLAASSSMTIMIGWYTLQLLDPLAWSSLLQGWLGTIYSQSNVIRFAARVADITLHFALPITLFIQYSSDIQWWMGIVSIMVTRLWVNTHVNSTHYPPAADHIYNFNPPRSRSFWKSAYRLQFILDLLIPIFLRCTNNSSRYTMMMLHKLLIVLVLTLTILKTARRDVILPALRRRAKRIMLRLLRHPTTRYIRVNDESIWLDWMTFGMLAIGESYMAKQWESENVDDFVCQLLNLPLISRRQMFHSWEARLVSLASRILSYKSSSFIVGSVRDTFVSLEFYQELRGTLMHPSFGIWKHNHHNLEEAIDEKFKLICEKVEVKKRVLDLSFSTYGGNAFAILHRRDNNIDTITCVVSTEEELEYARATNLHRDKITFILLKSTDDVMEFLKKGVFDCIICIGVIERVDDGASLVEFINCVESALSDKGKVLFEFVASTGTRSIVNSQLWTNTFIEGGEKRSSIKLPSVEYVKKCASKSLLQLQSIESFATDAERTYMEWYKRFHSRSELPPSFVRTWEFYLLHRAACYRVRTLQPYQLVYRKKKFTMTTTT